MTDLPGDPVAIPVPPALAETLGYRGDARFVSFRWSCMGDQVVFEDGQSSGTGQSHAFLMFKRHPAVLPCLCDVDLGSSEEDGLDVLLIDREKNTARIAPLNEAREFLAAQHPPAPELTPEQQEAFNRELERLMEEWRNRPIDWDAVARQQREQQTRMAVMLAYLDQRVPPSQGEGQAP